MKILFFGLGSIGERHAKILQKNFKHELVAFRHQKKTKNTLGIPEIYTWDEVENFQPDVVFITNPTSEHVKTAIRCAALGAHIFMEKPLSNRPDGLDKLEKEIVQNRTAFYTAYCLRFHPVIQEIKKLLAKKKVYYARVVCSSYLPQWRPLQRHKENYSALWKFGGGVFLDISHELDYVEYLFGPITSMIGQLDKLADVTVDVEDVADIVTTQKSGARVNIHLDYISPLPERTIKIAVEGGYIAGDLLTGQITVSTGKAVKQMKVKIDKEKMFKDQLNYFFKNLDNPDMMNNFHDSKMFIEKLLRFKKTWAKKYY